MNQDYVGATAPDTSDKAVAAATPTPATARPSLWSALWATLALLYLIAARRSFRKLG